MKNIIILSALSGVLTLSGCTMMKDMTGMNNKMVDDDDLTAPVTVQNGILVSSVNNKTLYTFDKDTMNKSNCIDDCIKAWPALVAPSNAQISNQYTTIQRDDGTYQWVANGKPLYFFVKDAEAGDVNGEGKGGVWHTVKAQ